MKRNCIKRILPALAISIFAGFSAGAEQVQKLDFTGVAKTGKVVITINDHEQTMVYYTPSRDNRYSILDYDIQHDVNSDSMTITATVLDPLFSTASEVLLYKNNTYADMRIGRKRITFSYVDDFRITK